MSTKSKSSSRRSATQQTAQLHPDEVGLVILGSRMLNRLAGELQMGVRAASHFAHRLDHATHDPLDADSVRWSLDRLIQQVANIKEEVDQHAIAVHHLLAGVPRSEQFASLGKEVAA